jgi:putative tryptophan/tyrosine transport system substrate-binding protein
MRRVVGAMITRRTLVVTLTLGALLSSVTAGAQPAARTPRIGVIFPGTQAGVSVFEAFRQGLREHGYVEGRNIVVERRFGEGRPERIAEAAAELVRLKVDVIVTSTDDAIAAVKRQTRTIPIVMTASTDPVGTGFVASLARPGGNVTGLSTMAPLLGAKRLELLKEAVPGLSRVAIMWDPDVRGALLEYKEAEEAARSLGLQLQSVEVSRADDFDRTFASLTSGRAQALTVVTSPLTLDNRSQIANLALKHRLPSIFGQVSSVEAGGLMAYGSSAIERWRRAATYVDKILKGVKPSDLPIEQPTKFELVINLKTAKALDLTIPQLLRRADHVIQ